MEYRDLELAISSGDFEQFCKAIQNIPDGEFPEVRLRPKLNIGSAIKEDSSIYLALLARNFPPAVAYKACTEYDSIDAALTALSQSK